MMELTTGHYDKDFDPNPVVLLKAAKEAALVLPRQIKQRPAPKTRKERIPLCSSLHGAAGGVCTSSASAGSPSRLHCAGPGRAGTHTTLFGSNGSKYIGQVLAGRPHGSGQFYEQVRGSSVCCTTSPAQRSNKRGVAQQVPFPALLDHPGAPADQQDWQTRPPAVTHRCCSCSSTCLCHAAAGAQAWLSTAAGV